MTVQEVAKLRSEVENASCSELRRRAELLAESAKRIPGVSWLAKGSRWIVRALRSVHGKRMYLGCFRTKADAIERLLRYDDGRERARAGNQKQSPAQPKQRPSEASGAAPQRPNKRRRTSTSPPSKQQQGSGRSRPSGALPPGSEAQGASCSKIRKRAELLAAAKGAKKPPRVPGVSWHSVAKGWTVYGRAPNAHGKMTQLHLGYFQTKADAIERRLRYDAARKGKQKQTPAQRKGSPAEAMGEATRQRNDSQLTTTPAAPPARGVGTPDLGGQVFQTQAGARDLDANAELASNLADSLQRSAREAVVLKQEMSRLIEGLLQENDALRKKHRDLEQMRLSHARNEEASHVNAIDDGGCARTRSYRWCARKRR